MVCAKRGANKLAAHLASTRRRPSRTNLAPGAAPRGPPDRLGGPPGARERPSGQGRSAQRGLDRLAEFLDAEGALQARGDAAVAVDREQPRLGLEVERLERRAQPLVDAVVAVDLLVDEGDPVAVLLLHLQR